MITTNLVNEYLKNLGHLVIVLSKSSSERDYLQSASVLIQHSLLPFESEPVNMKWGGLD